MSNIVPPQSANPDERVLHVREPDCWRLTLARADKAHALTAAMMRSLATAVARADAETPALPLLLSSAGSRAFCAGADIAEFGEGPDRLHEQETALLAMLGGMASTRSPIIAVAHGRASGAGLMLLCLADIVIAADNLSLSAPEIAFGMYPVFVEAVLQSRLAPGLSAQLCMSGRSLDAAAAQTLGLVTEVLPHANFAAESAARIRHYLDRTTALRTARTARIGEERTSALLRRLRQLGPLMQANFADKSVRSRVQNYLASLRARENPR